MPLVETLGIQCVSVEPRRAVLLLPDSRSNQNHLGGPHAGALFTLAETAAGALVFLNFADRLATHTPLVVRADIQFSQLAMGDVTATAVLDEDIAGLVAILDAGERPTWVIDVELATADGTVTATMAAHMTLAK